MKTILLAILAAALPLRPPHKAMETTPTARDYVQDGLVAMWDGIENAGWGVHVANPTNWVDLTGNGYNLPLNSHAQVLSSGIRRKSDNSHGPVGWVSHGFTTTALTLEACVSGSVSGQGPILSVGPIYTSGNQPTITIKQSNYFEWSSQINYSTPVFPGPTTLHSGYGKGFLNGKQLTSASTDTWGYTADRIAVLGDPRGSNYTPFGATLHCIRIYNRALTVEELRHNHDIDMLRFR
jgi:hypothetical protein